MIRLALFGAGTALLSWLLEIFGEHEINIAVEAALLLLALTLLAAYWHHARQTPYPLLQLALFKVRTFRVSVIGGFQQIQHFSRLSPTSSPDRSGRREDPHCPGGVPIVNLIRLAYSRESGDACAYGRHPQTDLVGGKLVVSIKSFGCPYRKPNATSV